MTPLEIIFLPARLYTISCALFSCDRAYLRGPTVQRSAQTGQSYGPVDAFLQQVRDFPPTDRFPEALCINDLPECMKLLNEIPTSLQKILLNIYLTIAAHV